MSGTDDRLRVALLTHHPIMRSETGPLSGCRCGAVGLGQDVIAHVAAELRAYGDLRAAEELRAAAAELHVLRFNADEDPDARWPHGAPRVTPDSFYKGVVLSELALKSRAAALTAREEAGR